MIITLGFTASHRPSNYFPRDDGFRPGALYEEIVDIDPARYGNADDTWDHLSITEIADHAYEATNHPFPSSLSGMSGRIADGVADAKRDRYRVRYIKALSIGDTVRVYRDQRTEMVACTRTGWVAVDLAEDARVRDARLTTAGF